ncbi:hypothetical protein AGDE_12077 [Angomonas deanei]|nr:hypothetical protein AGDE_12077 [Angomonas deanei]|eukprot:EPY24977.1 hypothetical protein AGDE_12077 [Angomonas deanei]
MSHFHPFLFFIVKSFIIVHCMQHTSVRFCSAGLRQAVEKAKGTSPYLRHMPPQEYFTCSADLSKALPRHKTELLDVGACSGGIPHTNGVYVLSSSTAEDVSFKDAKHRTMIGLPHAKTTDDVKRFIDHHQRHLESLQCVVLPDVSLSSGVALSTMKACFPQVRVVCSPFSKFLFSDPTFFAGVQSALKDNYVEGAFHSFTFAEIDPECISTAADGETVADCPRLRSLVVPLEKKKVNRPDHFTESVIFYYDEAFEHMHVGDSICRSPWWTRVVPEVGSDVLVPVCPLQSRQWSSRQGTSVLELWRPDVAAQAFSKTLLREPFVQEVLSTSYGALPGDLDDVAAALEDAGTSLEGLRSRLSTRLETDTERDVSRWSKLLLGRIIKEVLFTQTPSNPSPPEMQEALQGWLMEESRVGQTAVALTQSALALPPSAAPVAQQRAGVPAPEEKESKLHSKLEENSSELEGAAGVQLMTSLLTKKGMGGLSRVVEKENIDVRVFLSMTTDDFKNVFKATFGISKKLVMLQEELKEKMT